jgi:hypothetical protein
MVVENNEIFLGSGASLTFVPEVDFYIEPDDDGSTVTVVQLDTTNQIHFQLIDNMYVGCTLEFYDNGAYASSHTVTSNDNDELTFTPSIAAVDASHDYFILKGYGAPCPAPRIAGGGTLGQPTITTAGTQIEADESIITNSAGGSAGTGITGVSGITSTGAEIELTLSAESSTVTFPAESGSNYNSGFLTINLASPSGTSGISTLDILFNARSATVATSTGNDSITVLIANSALGE